MATSVGNKNVSTSCNSSKATSKMHASTSGNNTFSLSNSFEALNVDNPITEEVLLEGKCVLEDDDGKPLEKVDYLGDHDSKDEVEHVKNEMASNLASKPLGVGYEMYINVCARQGPDPTIVESPTEPMWSDEGDDSIIEKTTCDEDDQ
ncbi:hypothetical protein Tco_0472844 [Tanacetum coccineum]